MLGYALRRLLLALPLLVGITFISFVVIHLAPGEPTEMQDGGDLSTRSDKQMRERLPVQYWNWLTRLSRLDFGKSFGPDARPVLEKIGQRLPVTLLLNVVEMLIIIVLAVQTGGLPAPRQHDDDQHL